MARKPLHRPVTTKDVRDVMFPGRRATIAPLYQERNSGKVVIAVPGVLAEPYHAFGKLVDTTKNTAPQDRFGKDYARKVAAPALEMTGAIGGGGLVSPKPTGAIGMFGGRLAKTADLQALAKAESMAAKGASREEIFHNTGWFQGVDKKWRFEIDDSKMKFTDKAKSAISSRDESKPLIAKGSEVISHSELFGAYPQLKGTTIDVAASYMGYAGIYDQDANSLVVRSFAERSPISGAKKILAHEYQHGIQGIEGFAPGSSVEAEGGMARYRKIAGEVEARAVEKRLSMSPAERKATPPWLSYSVPEGSQITSPRQSGGPVNERTFRRTYKTGPKAGTTEIVRKAR